MKRLSVRNLLPALTIALLSTVPLCGNTIARAAESAPLTTARDTATLITDTDSLSTGQTFHAALRLNLKPGWHSYWRNAGDAGDAPTLDLRLTGAATAAGKDILWSVPRRLPEGALMSYGYTGDVILPVALTPKSGNGSTATLTAHAEWLVCAEVCVPESGDFQLALKAGTSASSAEAPLISAALNARPRTAPFTAHIAPDGALTLHGQIPDKIRDAWFLPDTPGLIKQAAPQPLTQAPDSLTLKLALLDGYKPGSDLSGVVVLKDSSGQENGFSISAKATATPAVQPASVSSSWLSLFLLAILGGLILNLMPCVFPVLAMKALALSRADNPRAMRRSALAYTAGVLVTFSALGLIVLAFRQSGIQAAWGAQFQSPAFVAGICWLLFAVGLGMTDAAGFGPVSAGQSLLSRSRGLAADFLTGLLAVLIATPCTAPFMGAALAGALAAPPLPALGIFLGLGLGLASPYLLLAALPGVARLFPRPGPWMVILRQALAFPVFGTCVWLAWVLVSQTGNSGILILGSGCLVIGLALWLGGMSRADLRPAPRLILRLIALLLLLIPLATLPALQETDAGTTESTHGAGSEPWSAARLETLRHEGRPVLVDMTAAWCITCLVNERMVLNTPRIRDAFRKRNIVWLRGDWTRRNPEISTFLTARNRDGVPLYVYYPPHGSEVILPQILTAEIVLKLTDTETKNH
ncbi:thioredoxin family protein [Acetobacter sp. AN02]|uniref:protein-disulfide reductase DsbD family protein n=1 Tax=Acetobacter sp. AN02 TaxID=2894186 RepID=UPI0024343731|nr:thioredoxin family protein [Acetobacter sp. AN02]MDG6095702.1 thioredoxin family protein [Acetobacter sp. AN02]